MKQKLKKSLLTVVKLLPLLMCIGFAGCYLMNRENISADIFINYVPENLFIAALFLILMYAAKSLSIFFPVMILYISGGYLFSPCIALAVNILGVLAELTIPYWIGRVSGADFANKLSEKYSGIKNVVSNQQNNGFFMAFFLRIICLPRDVVSIYFGVCRVPFGKYILGSLVGVIPSLVPATLLGASITDPTSPLFLISAVLIAVISVVSFLLYYFSIKFKSKSKAESE